MGLREYLIRRVIHTLILIYIALTVNFLLFRVMPGDPFLLIGMGILTQEQIQEMHHLYGLDSPFIEQYFGYLYNMAMGRFGYSFATFKPVIDELGFRLINTLMLMIPAMILSVALGVVLGVVTTKRTICASIVGVTSIAMYAFPPFWIGMVLLYVLAFLAGLFPIAGTTSRPPPVELPALTIDILRHMTLPMIALTIYFSGMFAILVRSAMLDELAQDYVFTAEAKGLKERHILFKHCLKNAMLPTTTVIALYFGLFVIGGAVLTETVFSWHGLGTFTVESVMRRDYPVLQAIFLLLTLTVILSSFIADILYGYMDPRVRY